MQENNSQNRDNEWQNEHELWEGKDDWQTYREVTLSSIVERGRSQTADSQLTLMKRLSRWCAGAGAWLSELFKTLKKRITALFAGKDEITPAVSDSTKKGFADAHEVIGTAIEGDMLSAQRRKIAQWIKNTSFKPKLFAGVDEADVWKKLRQLNRMYEDALLAERARFDTLLEQYRSEGDADPDTDADYPDYLQKDEDSTEEYWDENEYSDN